MAFRQNDDPEFERKRLLRRSDTLASFGTVTSLVSTGVYFAEQILVKKIPRWVSLSSLAGVAAGIGAIFVSMRDKITAGGLMPEDKTARTPLSPSAAAESNAQTQAEWQQQEMQRRQTPPGGHDR